jgi:opacity protein-like surface antigen
MLKRIVAMTGLLMLAVAAPGFAQANIEATVLGGWSFSDGVSGQSILASDGNLYNRLDPKDGSVFGLNFGWLFSDNAEVGFLWTRQSSKLTLGAATTGQDREVGDLSLLNYHGYLGYNFGEADAPVRPFLYGGLGATHFTSVDLTVRQARINGNTQFSTTWGAGVKFLPSPRIGIRVNASWTPTYVKSDAEGYWCDPWWGCYLVGDPQYSNQIHLTGGVIFRF